MVHQDHETRSTSSGGKYFDLRYKIEMKSAVVYAQLTNLFSEEAFRPSCLFDFIHILSQKKGKRIRQTNESSQCWRAQTQEHRLCQQHTFATVSSVITDWVSVITNSYWACDIPSDPIRDEELLIHKRDGSSCDE